MNAKLKRNISFFVMAFAMALLLSGPMTVKADLHPVEDPIKCGNNVQAVLDDGVLTLTGSGATFDYTPAQFMNFQSPFAQYSTRGTKKGQVKKIVVSNGITHIGNLLFYYVDAEKIVLGKDVQTIGEYAFAGNNKLKKIEIPNATKEIQKEAFYPCSNLSEISLGGTKKLGDKSFFGNKASSIIIPCYCSVPDSALAKSYNETTKEYTYPKLRWETWVTFNANGGTCKFGGLVRIYKEKYGYLPTPTKSGYTFLGWYVNEGNESVQVTSNSKVKWEPTLTAKWTKTLKVPTISKITAKSKGFTINVKNVASTVSGFMVQYATDSDFDNAVQKTYAKDKTSVTISKLKANKKYYVRIRTYTKQGTKKVYSSWSKVKTVKTKK